MAVLIDTFFTVYHDLREAVLTATPAALAAPNRYAPARAVFPSVRAFVAYLMTGHPGYHLGQLAGWRAAAGLGCIHRPDALAA